MNPNEELNEIDPGIERLLDLLKTFPERDSAKVQLGRTRFIAELDRLFPVHSANGHHALRSVAVEPGKRRSPTVTLFNRSLSLAWAAAVTLTLFFLVTTGVVTARAADAALPGDVLYPIKTGLEQARLAITTSPPERLNLYLKYADRRLQEADQLLEVGRYSDVARVVGELEANVRSADVALRSVEERDPLRGRDLKTDMVVRLSGFSVIVNSLSATAPPVLQPALQSSLASIEEIIVEDGRPGSDLPASSGEGPQDNSTSGQPPNSGDLPGNRPPAGPGSNDPPPANDPGEDVPPDGDGGSRVNPGSGSANNNDGNGGRNNNGSNPGSDTNTNDGGSSDDANNPDPDDQGNGSTTADALPDQSDNSNADDTDANSNAASDGDSESLASNANDAADTPADNPASNANDSSNSSDSPTENADDPGANDNDADDGGPSDQPPAEDQPDEPGDPDPGADCADENGDGRCDEPTDPGSGSSDGDQPEDSADRNRGNDDESGGRDPAGGGSSDDSGGDPPADDGGESNNPADDSGGVDDGNPAPNSSSKSPDDGAPTKANVDSEKKSALESSRTS